MTRLATALLLAASVSVPAAVHVEDLRCEYRSNPLGIDIAQPRLSWRLAAPPAAKGVHQTAWRILVASTDAGLRAGTGDLWDSGKIVSEQSVQIVYAGKPLGAGVKAFWKVQVWGQDETPTWSAPAFWSMGMLDAKDWTAKWIGRDETALVKSPDSPYHLLRNARWIWTSDGGNGVRILQRKFALAKDRGPLKRALCVMGAENRFDLSVNGKSAGFGTFAVMPEVIDITPLLAEENTLSVKVTHSGKTRPGGLIGAVRLEYAKGEPVILTTDPAWTSEDPAQSVVAVGPYGMAPWGEVGFKEERWLPSRMLRKEFDAAKPIRRATAYVSGLGLFELQVNGVKAGNDVLSPGLTEYPKRVLYATYDVTAALKQGRNALGVLLGNGRYYGPRDMVPTFAKTYGYPKLLLQLDLEYADGSTGRVVSDETWHITTDGPIRGNNEYDGEEYDGRREMPGWSRAGFQERPNWTAANIVDAPGGMLAAQMAEPIRVTETIKPVKMTKLRPGVFIFDMGQNMVGWCRLHVTGPKGTAVRLRFAETLAEDGSLYTANLRSARAADDYILSGVASQVWEPRFTYHGFRYVEVTGYPGVPKLSALEGRVVHDAMEPAGSFESSNTLLNRIHKNTYWGVRGNYRSIPTDCPQRDERQGWMGDRSQVSRSETYLFNVAAFYTKWMTDIADAQREDGAISDVSPAYWPLYNNDVTWPSTFVLLPGTLYEQYGDTRVIARNYDAMKKWMALMQGFLKDDLLTQDTYGDWCVPPESPELIHSKDSARQTDKTLLATAYFHHLARKMSEYARLIDRPQDAATFDALATRLRTAFEKKFFKPAAGLYDNGTQTSSLLPLAFGMTEQSERGRVLDALVNRIHTESKDHIGTGLVGAQWLLRVLSDNGHSDLAYTIATQKTYPGWGYMVEKGATTVWELWNGDTADPAMNSGNHVMQIGDLTIWMYEYLGGIRPDPAKPGYKHFIVRPTPPKGLDWIRVTRQTQYGEIQSSWKREKGSLTMNLVVPSNTSATVWVPGESTPREVVSGSHTFTGRPE